MTNSTKLTDIPGAREALPTKSKNECVTPDGRYGYEKAVNEVKSTHLEVDVEAMALEIARDVFGIYAPNAKAVPEPLWKDYVIFAKHIADNPKKWARLVSK